MKRIVILSLCICFAVVVGAQTPLENAEYLYEDKNYVDAAEAFKKEAEKLKKPYTRAEIYAKIGHCYYYTQNFNEAEKWYKKAADGGYASGEFFLKYGDANMFRGNYTDAVKWFEKAKAADSSLARLADVRIRSSNGASQKEEFPGIILHNNIKEINTPMGEYGIGLMGDRLVITSTRINKEDKADERMDKTTGQGFARLYYTSHDENNVWKMDGKLPESINSAYNNGTFCYHEPTQTAYYSQCNGFDGKGKTCKIFSTQYDASGKTWSKPEQLTFNSDEYNCSQPAISTDGKVLYFASDKEGGFGKKDLYKSIKGTSRLWGDPINLGKDINGPGDDVFPTVSGDSLFFFSSDGREGLGGLDIYKATLVNGVPKNPEWVDMPFNSAGDDFGLIYGANKLEGFYCSNRIGGFGGDDVYQFAMDPRYKTVAGYIREEKTGLPVAGAKVVLTGTDGSVLEAVTDASGKYVLKNANPEVGYRVLASNDGYFSNSAMIPAINLASKENPEDKLKQRNNAEISLLKITKEEIKLDNIYYAYNSADLTEPSKTELMKLVKLLKETPNVNIVLNAHTDEQGSDKYNIQLSDKRAASVVKFLTENGIDGSRLTSKGWGESNPVFKNATTEDQHAANRRTTFQVTNLEQK